MGATGSAMHWLGLLVARYSFKVSILGWEICHWGWSHMTDKQRQVCNRMSRSKRKAQETAFSKKEG